MARALTANLRDRVVVAIASGHRDVEALLAIADQALQAGHPAEVRSNTRCWGKTLKLGSLSVRRAISRTRSR
jgi:hypothetical protein